MQDDDPKTALYDIDLYVQDAVSLHITPFMLDQYANEYEELVRKRDAHAIEVDSLRTTNRTLSNQVYALRCADVARTHSSYAGTPWRKTWHN